MFRIFLYSIFIGAGGIAPGLSGGTISIILGVHRKLVDAIGCLFKKPFDSIRVLIPAGAGALIGVVVFSVIQKELFQYYQMQTLFCFIGLMLGSLPFLFREANSKDPLSRNNLSIRLPLFLMAVLIGLLMVYFDNQPVLISGLDSIGFSWSIGYVVSLILLGILISASLIIPGISGTVLLVLIGQYGMVLGLIAGLKDFVFPLQLFLIGFGVLAGVFVFSKLLSIFFCRWHGATYAVILGFVVGSVPALYPSGSNLGFNVDTFSSFVFFLLGLTASYWFGAKGMRLKD